VRFALGAGAFEAVFGSDGFAATAGAGAEGGPGTAAWDGWAGAIEMASNFHAPVTGT
jgi:hypothetical protein